MRAAAEAGWWHVFGFLNLDRLRAEVKLAETDAAANLTQATQHRLHALKDALNR
jgi:DNA primase